jgi:hypothetical protein
MSGAIVRNQAGALTAFISHPTHSAISWGFQQFLHLARLKLRAPL